MKGRRWNAVELDLRTSMRWTLTFVLVLLVTTGATVSVAHGANRCTRYAGYPRGVWDSSSCGSRTGWDTFYANGGGLATNSTAIRDDNFMNASSQLCTPKRLDVWFYNPSTDQTWGSKSDFCVTSWIWNGSSGYTYAECKLWVDNGGSGTIDGECHTTWTQ